MATAVVERVRSADRSSGEKWGLGLLVLVGVCLLAVGAGWLPDGLNLLLLVVIGLALVGLIMAAVLGGPDLRRALAPYGLLKPGSMWLALFYLAPLWTLLRNSLSAKKTRFDVQATFSWEFSNYGTAFSDFGPQFGRAFLYAGVATSLTILIGYRLRTSSHFVEVAGGTSSSVSSSFRSSRVTSFAPLLGRRFSPIRVRRSE